MSDRLYQKIDDSIRVNWVPNWDMQETSIRQDSSYYVFTRLKPIAWNIVANKEFKSISYEYAKYIVTKVEGEGNYTFFLGKYSLPKLDSSRKVTDFPYQLFLNNIETGENYLFDHLKSQKDESSSPDDRNKRVAGFVCGDEYTCTWYSNCTSGVYITSTTGIGSCVYPDFSPDCYAGSWTVSFVEEVRQTCWYEDDPYFDDPGFPEDLFWFYETDTPENIYNTYMVVEGPSNLITNVPNYLNCLRTSVSASSIKLKVYVDKPFANSSHVLNPFATGGHKVGTHLLK